MGNKVTKLIVSLLIIGIVPVKPAYAATITVSPGQSIQSAANSANSGDTVSVSAGIYNETVSVSRPGITFQANGAVTMKGFHITPSGDNTTVSGFRIDDTPLSGIELFGSDSIIKNNIITRGRNAGIFVTGQNNLIENNDVSNIIQPKPHSEGGDANCMSFFNSGHVFRGNTCHDIYRNGTTVTDAHIDAFQTWDWPRIGGAGHDILFEKNVLLYPMGVAVGWMIHGPTYNITIKNNIIYNVLGASIVGGVIISRF